MKKSKTTFHTVICDVCSVATVLDPNASQSILDVITIESEDPSSRQSSYKDKDHDNQNDNDIKSSTISNNIEHEIFVSKQNTSNSTSLLNTNNTSKF